MPVASLLWRWPALKAAAKSPVAHLALPIAGLSGRAWQTCRAVSFLRVAALLRLLASLRQALLLAALCPPSASRALIERVAGRWMAGRWIWTPCSIHPLPIKRLRLWIHSIPILVASFLPM